MFENLETFQRKVDQSFLEMRQRHDRAMLCKKGCHSCCLKDIRVSHLEREYLKAHLQQHPEKVEQIRKTNSQDPHKGQRCSFLDATGHCMVYEARPIVCRTHGAPIEFKDSADEDVRYRDVCPLNFQGLDLNQLAPEAVLNLDSINAILSVLNRYFDSSNCEVRYTLNLQEIL